MLIVSFQDFAFNFSVSKRITKELKKMRGKRISLQIRYSAEKDFCGGMTLREISEKYNVLMRTVRMWYTKESWKEKRARVKAEVQEQNALKLIESMTQNTVAWVTTAKMISAMGAKYCREIFEKQINGKASPQEVEFAADMCGRITKMAVDIQTRAMPQGQEEVMSQFIRDVERIKEMIAGDTDEQI